MEISRGVLTAFGIEPEYEDIWGKKHSTSPEVARAILRSLGAGANPWSHALDPTILVSEDADFLPLRVPADRSDAQLKLEFEWEGGEIEHRWFWPKELPELERVRIDGRDFVAKRVPLDRLRLGYHRLRVLDPAADARFIVCPRETRQPERPCAGVAVSLYGLRSRRNWGCGDFTDLRALIDTLAPSGIDFVALNPLHAIPNRQPYNTSPYLPQCSLYRNFIYLDAERAGATADDANEIEALRESEFVEYERVAALKLRALRQAFDSFAGSSEFDRFVAEEGAPLHDFAVYCALDEAMHRRDANVWLWRDWPAEYQDPRSAAVAQFAQEHSHDVLFFKFLQWHIDRQLAEVQAHALDCGMKIGLYHDLALATDRWGADLWANRPFYADGCRVGAPPDDFSPNGQDWAFPPPNREAHRANGYELFAQLIRKTARHGGALRIDHVMRFFRLWWIPDGMPANQGAYVRDYTADLLGILKLESRRGGFIVIGEDLGTVTGEVRAALTEAGILSYRVLWFERHLDGTFKRPGEYPVEAAATTSTHDLPTLAGFFGSHDIKARRAAGLIDEAAYVQQMKARASEIEQLKKALAEAGFPGDPLGFLLSTPSKLAIINEEDMTGEAEQQNLPGSTWQRPNWRRKMRITIEESRSLTAAVTRCLREAGR